MIAVLVLFVVSAVVGLVVLLRVRSGSAADPADVRLEPAVAREMVQEHPALARLLRRRVDPTVASGLALTAAAAVAVGGALGVGLVLEMVQRRAGLARLDDSAARFGVKHLTAAGRRVFKTVTQFGSTIVIVPMAVVVAVVEWRRRPTRAVPAFLTLAIGGTVSITNLVKVLVNRARPDIARLVGFSGPSFPSGHSSSAAATYAAFVLVVGRGRSRRVKATLAAMVAVAVGRPVEPERVARP